MHFLKGLPRYIDILEWIVSTFWSGLDGTRSNILWNWIFQLRNGSSLGIYWCHVGLSIYIKSKIATFQHFLTVRHDFLMWFQIVVCTSLIKEKVLQIAWHKCKTDEFSNHTCMQTCFQVIIEICVAAPITPKFVTCFHVDSKQLVEYIGYPESTVWAPGFLKRCQEPPCFVQRVPCSRSGLAHSPLLDWTFCC